MKYLAAAAVALGLSLLFLLLRSRGVSEAGPLFESPRADRKGAIMAEAGAREATGAASSVPTSANTPIAEFPAHESTPMESGSAHQSDEVADLLRDRDVIAFNDRQESLDMSRLEALVQRTTAVIDRQSASELEACLNAGLYEKVADHVPGKEFHIPSEGGDKFRSFAFINTSVVRVEIPRSEHLLLYELSDLRALLESELERRKKLEQRK